MADATLHDAIEGKAQDARAPRPAPLLAAVFLVSLGLVIAGLVAPAVSVSAFWVFEERYSVLGGILRFFERGEAWLGALLFAVSVVFPLAKIAVALGLALRPPRRARMGRALGVLGALSRWSMTDVFLLALVVLLVNGQLLTTADLHEGVGLFAAGILISTAALHSLRRHLSRE